ncbi:MAG: amidohydrolase [Thermoprotei archaeon]|nr:MAG: amidohydrolase [Thermoprotei archaeon]
MLVIRGGKVYTVTRGVIEEGVIVVGDDGKIKAVGKAGEVEIPKGADILDAKGMHIMPGMIDPHTHIGVHELAIGWEGRDTNETTEPVTPHLRAIDGIKSDDEGFYEALSHGVTTVGVLPGSANPIGGLGVAMKTYGKHKLDMVVKEPIGLKIAFGENPKRTHGLENKRSPATRMAIAGLIREWLTKAQNYMRKKDLFKDQPEKLPDKDLRLEALELLLRRKIPARAHAHLADDILTAISIAEEFGFDIVLDHSTESHRIPEVLASRNIPAVVGPLLTAKYKVELRNRTTETPGILAKHGVKVAITTDHPVVPIKLLPIQVAIAIRDGLSFEDALKAVTINAADILGLADRLGSIEPGKDGDIIVLNAPPFQVEARVVYTIINGKIVYSAEEAKK